VLKGCILLKEVKISGHVTGQELSEGIKKYALDQYGPMAEPINSLGNKSRADLGCIVL